MIRTILFSAFLMAATMADAQSKQEPEHYCAQEANGKITVMYKSAVLTHDVSLDNGSVLKSDGTLVKKNGSRVMLKAGECVAPSGKMTILKTEKNPK